MERRVRNTLLLLLLIIYEERTIVLPLDGAHRLL